MGLDITAVSKLVRMANEPKTDEEWDDFYEGDGFKAFWYDSLAHSGAGLVKDACYEPTADSKYHGFRAGSYGGYGQWRKDLADFAGFTLDEYWEAPDTGQPFYELIHFADNEGTIGPDA